jgi:hypothetical protein
MNESIAAAALEGVAAYIGIDWADQKHDVVLRSASEPHKVEHRVIEHKVEALQEWIGQLQQRFGVYNTRRSRIFVRRVGERRP